MIVAFNEIHTDVVGFPKSQFLIVDLEIEGSDLVASDLNLTVLVDDDRFPNDRRYYYLYRPNRSGSQLAFPISCDPDPSSISIQWPREPAPVQWALPSDIVGEFRTAPKFSMQSITVPNELADRSATLPVEYHVANTGERSGTFLAEIGTSLISDHAEFGIEVPVDHTVSNRVTLDPHIPDDVMSFEVVIDWGWDRYRESVTIQ